MKILNNFIAFEGLDNEGKTTSMYLVQAELDKLGYTLKTYQDPYDSKQYSDNVALDIAPRYVSIGSSLIYTTELNQRAMIDIERGFTVLKDRSQLSALAYQDMTLEDYCIGVEKLLGSDSPLLVFPKIIVYFGNLTWAYLRELKKLEDLGVRVIYANRRGTKPEKLAKTIAKEVHSVLKPLM